MITNFTSLIYWKLIFVYLILTASDPKFFSAGHHGMTWCPKSNGLFEIKFSCIWKYTDRGSLLVNFKLGNIFIFKIHAIILNQYYFIQRWRYFFCKLKYKFEKVSLHFNKKARNFYRRAAVFILTLYFSPKFTN
jgi:hypothetical protein